MKNNSEKGYKILIWGMGEKYNLCCNLLKYFQIKNEIQLIGITQHGDMCSGILDEIPIIEPKDALQLQYDYIMLMTDIYFRDIYNELLLKEIKAEKIISYKVLFIPQVNLSQYFQLKRKKISIISINCWGGIAYSILGLECRSPFKNLFVSDDDFLKIINNFSFYMNCTPYYDHGEIDPHSRMKYPVLKLKNIFIHCNHSKTADAAIEDWERRKRKINYNNLFFMMYTDNSRIAHDFSGFCEKENQKGVCFVPWETVGSEKYQIQLGDNKSELWMDVNNSVSMKGIGMHYDLVNLLLGEKNSTEVVNKGGRLRQRDTDSCHVSSSIL